MREHPLVPGWWTPLVGILILLSTAMTTSATNQHYPTNREPLAPNTFVALPLGSVKPMGWLKDQLRIQAEGATGHLDEFWPSLLESAWRSKDGEAWERGPYYLDGLVPLAFLLDDERLIAKLEPWMDFILNSSHPNGWFGPKENTDRWPLAVGLKVLTQYYEATNDPRALAVIKRYFDFLANSPPDWPENTWRGMRAMETTVTAFWLYRRTGDPKILDVARSIHDHSFDWTGYFQNFPYTDEALAQGFPYNHTTHVVNIAMGLKYPTLWYQQARNPALRKLTKEGLALLDRYHGQTAGRFSGDEHLIGKNPAQGTEMCAVVETMWSLENAVMITGDAELADRLEVLTYNAKPGGCTADYWTHQYDQQSNQVLVSVARRAWSTNDDTSNIYGLEPNFGCCTANKHQGWPKFVANMWMATQDNGLAAIAFGPSKVTAKVADGVDATVTQTTDYPFDGTIEFTVDVPQPTAFPLYIRIPRWADDATIYVADADGHWTREGTFRAVRRTWKRGDKVRLEIPMKIRVEERYKGAVSILRGPLYYSLKIGEKRTKLKVHHKTLPIVDWQIEPTTPWNYGLLIDRENPEPSFEVIQREVADTPFATEDAPVVLRVKARELPQWTMEQHSAADPPKSPTWSKQPLVDVELIPYGSTRLRITEFPTITD